MLILTGLDHFSLVAYGLQSLCLRLTPEVTPRALKTRYEMCRANTFPVTLSVTSKQAPRGAQVVEEPVARTPPQLEPHRALLGQWAHDNILPWLLWNQVILFNFVPIV